MLSLMATLSEIGFALSHATRARALEVLLSGRFLSVTDLARICRAPVSSTSEHLAVLERCGLLRTTRVGRNRYFTLASPEVAALIEAAGVVSAGYTPPRSLAESERTRLEREGRFCWHHLAGRLGIELRDRLLIARALRTTGDDAIVTRKGAAFARDLLGVEVAADTVVPSCVDFTERLLHMRGSFAAAIARRFTERKYVRDGPGRAAVLTPAGKDFMQRLAST